MIDALPGGGAQATRLQIPLIYGEDSVHGHNNLVGATVFPHNIGIGATRDPRLVAADGAMTATETRATGVPWAFSPCLCVDARRALGPLLRVLRRGPGARRPDGDDHRRPPGRRPATCRGTTRCSPPPSTSSATAARRTARRTTRRSYTIDQGVTTVTQAQLDALYLAPFKPAVRSTTSARSCRRTRASTIIGDGPAPGQDARPRRHDHRRAEAAVRLRRLRDQRLAGHQPDPPATTPTHHGPASTRASTWSWSRTSTGLRARRSSTRSKAGRRHQRRGSTTRSSRILTQKFELGPLRAPVRRPQRHVADDRQRRAPRRRPPGRGRVAGPAEERGRRAAAQRTPNVYVAGSNADDLGNQTGGWTVTWQGASGNHTPGHDDPPGHAGRSRRTRTSPTRGRLRADGGLRRRRGRRRRDAVRGGRRRRRRPHGPTTLGCRMPREPKRWTQGADRPRRQGLRGDEVLRRPGRLRPAAAHHRPARRGRRPRRVLAARHRGRRGRRRPLRAARRSPASCR